jgi:branched-chain amino acid transport system substrate-binding protein
MWGSVLPVVVLALVIVGCGNATPGTDQLAMAEQEATDDAEQDATDEAELAPTEDAADQPVDSYVAGTYPIECGLNTGEPATGRPIKVGAIAGATGGDDFTSGTDAADAYFRCVNDNGGINGRPIDYIVEDDQWNPAVAQVVAQKLVVEDEVVALVGNGSFVEMAVNSKLYIDNNVVSVPSGCGVRECFESPNMSSFNGGPLNSNLGMAQYAFDEFGVDDIACIGLNIPSNGVWSCEGVIEVALANGAAASFVPLDPIVPDCDTAMATVAASDADAVLLNQPVGLALCLLEAAERRGMRGDYTWLAPTPLYDVSVPRLLGEEWFGQIHTFIELAPFESSGPDATNWRNVMVHYAGPTDRLDSFSQSGYLAAKLFTDVLLTLDPDSIDRATVSEAIRAVKRYDTDLLCTPWYFGPGDEHSSNHAGRVVKVVEHGYEVVSECLEVPGSFFDYIRTYEKVNGLGIHAEANFGADGPDPEPQG